MKALWRAILLLAATTLDDLRCLCAADNKAKSNGPPLAERKAPLPQHERKR